MNAEIESLRESHAPFEKLTDTELETLIYDWPTWARVEQRTPDGDWAVWLILAGRGYGKTRVGAEQVRAWIKAGRRSVNLIAATSYDLRHVMIEGESGILSVCPPDERPIYQSSTSELRWPNGAKSLLFSAEEPDRLRGPQCEALWMDEIASWQYAEDAWDMAMFGLRVGPHPQVVATTTPRPTPLIRRLMHQEHVHVTRGTTYENRSNLASSFYEQIVRRYEGTRLGRQELNAEILDDNPGALWKLSDIEAARIPKRRDYQRIVVAIDPAVTSNPDSDETGIVVAGLFAGSPTHFDVLEDASGIYTPDAWAKRAIELYWQWEADRVIGEANNGGDMIEAVLRHLDPNVSYHKVTASRGKAIRAEPIASLYEQHRVHHVGTLAKLEDQMLNWVPDSGGRSPDRVDALVWAITELSAVHGSGFTGYYEKKSVKYDIRKGESRMTLPKDIRVWSQGIKEAAIEIHPTIDGEEWRNGFGRELGDWVEFCRKEGGDRLKFAMKLHGKLEAKFGKVE